MNARKLAMALLLLGLGVPSCTTTPPASQVVIFVFADPGVVDRAVRLRVQVYGGDRGGASLIPSELVEQEDYDPAVRRQLALAPLGNDPERLFRVVAQGIEVVGGTETPFVSSSVVSGYIEGETRVIQLRLWDTCVGTTCDDQTLGCVDAVCVANYKPPTSLDPFEECPDGQLRCSEGCQTVDDDVANCGACGTVCAAGTRGQAVCTDGACGLVCPVGSATCDGDASDCETDVTTATDCGGCGIMCSGATPFCQDMGGGTFECTNSCGALTLCGSSCVDTQNSPLHCSDCNMPCPARNNATPNCDSGTCGFDCNDGFGDCDGDPSNGCETNVNTSALHCGACDMACPMRANATPRCTNRTCGFTCQGVFRDCDTNPTNGCETATNTTVNCGFCGNECTPSGAPPNMMPVCNNGVQCGFTCQGPYGDCDSNPANGCEANRDTDPSNCGSCGTRCGAAMCVSRLCTCPAGSLECGADPIDCCLNGTEFCNVNQGFVCQPSP
ncbi:MAG: hypothetical protein R3B40_14880 [Polyangiales bacterium]